MVKLPTIEKLFWYILTYSFLLPILSFLFFFNKLKYKRVVIVIIIYSLTIFLFLSFDDYLNRVARRWYSMLYTIVEYSCFSFIIRHIIQKKLVKALIFGLSILFIFFEISYFFVVRFAFIDSIPIGIETILILLYTFYLFFEQFKKIETGYMYNKSWFWFVVGILFYLCSSFFLNILASSNYALASKYWFLTWIFETVKNILFVIGIVFLAKKEDNAKKSSIPYLDLI